MSVGTPSVEDLLRQARRVADAVLYEGYLLYPYRATSTKNQVRWQFGVLGPPGSVEAGVGEPSAMGTSCLLQTSARELSLEVHVRFLQVQRRQVEQRQVEGRGPEEATGFHPVEELSVAGTSWVSWQEAVEQEVVVAGMGLDDLLPGRRIPISVAGGSSTEPVTDGTGDGPDASTGEVAARLVRTRYPLEGRLEVSAEPVDADRGLYRLSVRVANLTAPPAAEAGPVDQGAPVAGEDRHSARNRAAEHSFVGTHLLLAVRGGVFASAIDPPDDLVGVAPPAVPDRCWPVLIGRARTSPLMLVAPIILEDCPAVAPESPGDLFDATEIDEILTLRVQTLTEQEKAAARATDGRAAAILDRCDGLSDEEMLRLHGARRDPADAPPEAQRPGEDVPWWDPEADAAVDPGTDVVRVAGVPVARGSRVLLRPSRRADAQDLFLAGRAALVAGVHADVDGGTHVAVTLEDDPAADLHEWYGRYYYFGPEELEPLTPEASDAGPGAAPDPAVKP